MKDSSVAPAGLFDVRRQRQLLDGLVNRYRSCLIQQQQLQQQHATQRREEEQALAADRAETLARCRQWRRETLASWDQAEEDLIRTYESTAIELRSDVNRLAAIYRRKLEEEQKAIDRKVEARRQAVLHQYENRKNQPGQQQRKEHKLLDEALVPIRHHLERARAITIRRLDGLPEVSLEEQDSEMRAAGSPESVKDAIGKIAGLTRRCKKRVDEMQTGTASRLVDSFYLPVGVAVFVAIWATVAYFVAPYPPWLWMASGIIPAGVLGFAIYVVLLLPLKKVTRQLYPDIERLANSAERCAKAARQISSHQAAETSAELVQRRDEHLEVAQRWKQEQTDAMHRKLHLEQDKKRSELFTAVAAADGSYNDHFAKVSSDMRSQAEAVADKITRELAATDHRLQQRRDAAAARRHAQLQRLTVRWNDGIRRGLQRIDSAYRSMRRRFPDWQDVVLGKAPTGNLDYLPLGNLRVEQSLKSQLQHCNRDPSLAEESLHLAESNGSAEDNASPIRQLKSLDTPSRLPVGIHRRLQSGVIIQADPSQLDAAIDVAHQLLWRALSGAVPGRTKLTLLDPLGRGQHFTSFMALADYDPAIVGHRVWTTESKIEDRLEELAHHVEDVLQSSLRDRFERIEDYNELAGTMAEPYRIVAAIGFPEALSRNSYRHLRALIESGLRCGVFTVLVCDSNRSWPNDMPLPQNEKLLQLDLDDQGRWQVQCRGLEEIPFEPNEPPAEPLRHELVDKLGAEAVTASRVEVPLEQLLSDTVEGSGDSSEELAITIGSQGANRRLKLVLGHGVKQHLLIAGKTGSGKSTLLHSMITSAAYLYLPTELQFYLLDFKKGVEFKSYADRNLPHARVIGIESEREFGRSVLQRLDEELQQRGEAFRKAGVQELCDYRQATQQSMPRICLVVDEFQELFVRDDRLAGDCAMLLDRLVRQGRSFGMHVILSSQSLAGAYSLPRATLGQMAVRIAMQCSESDAALILSDDNTAARLISRPGEAIYNDAGGLIEGNQPFQVAWLSNERHDQMLRQIAVRDADCVCDLPPAVVFEGNRPCRWTPALAEAVGGGDAPLAGLLGESVAIGPPVDLRLSRDNGRNVLLIASADARSAVVCSAVSGLVKAEPKLQMVYLDGARGDDGKPACPWLVEAGIDVRRVRPRDSEAELRQIADLVSQRADRAADEPPVLLVIDPLERFRDLRQGDAYQFSLDAAAGPISGAIALQNILRDGPSVGVFTILTCSSAEILSRWLPRASQHDLELRILGQMNPSDSALLIDSPAASELSTATMLVYDDSDGQSRKFRQTDQPDPQAIRQWLASR